jgi:hypothetical protein
VRIFRFAMIGLLAVTASAVAWRTFRARLRHPANPPPAQTSAAQPANPQLQNLIPQSASATVPAGESVKHLGPFSISTQDFTVELQTRKLRPGSAGDSGDTVVAMEIQDATGRVQYRRMFPYVEATEDYLESWSVSARLLSGTNGTGLLVSYGGFSEPSAPEEEPTGWFQVFGIVNGKFAPFGAPLEVQGGLLDEYVSGNIYKAARPLGAQADVVEFKVWTGHCRLIFPVRVDWTQGRLTPAQECAKTADELGAGCRYKVMPEDKLYKSGITFVRLWTNPDEKSGQPVKTVVKKDSKVDLLTALVGTHWMEGKPGSPAAHSKGPMDDAGSFGATSGEVPDSDLWLKVRIDGREGWMHSEEDFRALGLPEDE